MVERMPYKHTVAVQFCQCPHKNLVQALHSALGKVARARLIGPVLKTGVASTRKFESFTFRKPKLNLALTRRNVRARFPGWWQRAVGAARVGTETHTRQRAKPEDYQTYEFNLNRESYSHRAPGVKFLIKVLGSN